ncbi:hypothetical protein P7K49_035815 [Saguinus oedipus]|uniref:Uncharacterized protein n=1 Tax=Saguinus oedipus TaxID=9490 RepID=A0ABQ9TNP3_SAGOE|nr:hypothetical protein P7K49_035815 [Saguinus oedipus]
MPLAKDLLHPSPEEERKHRKKCLVQSPSSSFMDVQWPGCGKITTVVSQAQTIPRRTLPVALLRDEVPGWFLKVPEPQLMSKELVMLTKVMELWHGLVIAAVSLFLQACILIAFSYLLSRHMGNRPSILFPPSHSQSLQQDRTPLESPNVTQEPTRGPTSQILPPFMPHPQM